MKKNESGFTLIELMIVIAIIAIIAAIAIPNLLAAKLSSNETAAIATLRNLTSCQAQIQTSGKIDTDNDGIGEFGVFQELTGTKGVRKLSTAGTSSVGTGGTPVSPAVLSPSLANVDTNGFVTKAGYAFMIFLPDNNATAAQFVHETNTGGTFGFSGGIATDLSEQIWCAYGQPVAFGNSGNRRFFVNQAADVIQSSNENSKAQGVAAVINGNSAFSVVGGGGGITARIAIGTTGFDGDVWKVTN